MSYAVSEVLLVAVVLVRCAAGHPNIFSHGHNDTTTTSIEGELGESKIEDIEKTRERSGERVEFVSDKNHITRI